MLHQKWQALFEDCFQRQYALIHRLETNKLRNVAKFFAHLLYTDAISWAVLSSIHLTEDDTTSSSRIFIKILFQVGLAFILCLCWGMAIATQALHSCAACHIRERARLL